MVVEATPPIAPEYERVHFIGHAAYNPGISREQLMAMASEIELEIEQRTGFNVFLVNVAVKHYPPFMTDVDYVMDVPTSSPIAFLTIIAILVALGVIFAFIVFLFWTTWIDKLKIYVCDQCSDYPTFEGWLDYIAHLKVKHPAKYDAIMEAKSTDWWAKIPSMIKWVAGAAVAVTVVSLIATFIPRGER